MRALKQAQLRYTEELTEVSMLIQWENLAEESAMR